MLNIGIYAYFLLVEHVYHIVTLSTYIRAVVKWSCAVPSPLPPCQLSNNPSQFYFMALRLRAPHHGAKSGVRHYAVGPLRHQIHPASMHAAVAGRRAAAAKHGRCMAVGYKDVDRSSDGGVRAESAPEGGGGLAGKGSFFGSVPCMHNTTHRHTHTSLCTCSPRSLSCVSVWCICVSYNICSLGPGNGKPRL